MSADSPPHTAGMRTDLSSGAGAMARGAARGALGAMVASVLALAFQAIVRHIVDIDTMGLFTLATTVRPVPCEAMGVLRSVLVTLTGPLDPTTTSVVIQP